jgi:hypothetical protein
MLPNLSCGAGFAARIACARNHSFQAGRHFSRCNDRNSRFRRRRLGWPHYISQENSMSDITTPVTPPIPRPTGRFTKGGPGGPGRPRGSINRGDPVMARAVVTTLLKLGGLERRVALLEAELKRRERAGQPRHPLDRGRLASRFRTFLTHVYKRQKR